MSQYKLIHADCLDAMTRAKPESVDAIVSDPPYGLAFMGKQWDHGVPGKPFWEAALRVAKPGAHLLAFGGTRTYHRLACAIEDAGWEIRDCIMWVYGSGFPKSHNLKGDWQGWGTALKPAFEPVILARKPFASTVAANVLEHGTGGLNVDGCRVAPTGESLHGGGSTVGKRAENHNEGWQRPWMKDESAREAMRERSASSQAKAEQLGRWPANLIHDESDEATGLLGDAARFFYCAKASKKDRNEGCEALEAGVLARSCQAQAEAKRGNVVECEGGGAYNKARLAKNNHPTVKPTDLMRYLCRLITPPSGVILDPFMGSGSTGKAAILEGFRFIGIEKEAEYLEIAKARIEFALSTGKVK